MDLAVATGYSLRYIGDVERGAKSATLRTMNDLATLLGLQLGEIISRAERRLTHRDRGAYASKAVSLRSKKTLPLRI